LNPETYRELVGDRNPGCIWVKSQARPLREAVGRCRLAGYCRRTSGRRSPPFGSARSDRPAPETRLEPSRRRRNRMHRASSINRDACRGGERATRLPPPASESPVVSSTGSRRSPTESKSAGRHQLGIKSTVSLRGRRSRLPPPCHGSKRAGRVDLGTVRQGQRLVRHDVDGTMNRGNMYQPRKERCSSARSAPWVRVPAVEPTTAL